MSYGSTSPALSDRSKFPLFFRTIAPESTRNAARVAFVNHFGWRTVTTFTQSENYFLLPANRLIASLERSNVSCFAVITFSVDNYKEQLRDLKVSILELGGWSKWEFIATVNHGFSGPGHEDYYWEFFGNRGAENILRGTSYVRHTVCQSTLTRIYRHRGRANMHDDLQNHGYTCSI